METDKFKVVPKNFYTNYKTNMMREAHDIANAIVMMQDDPDMKLECDHDELDQCDCANHGKNNLMRRYTLANTPESILNNPM